MKLLFNLGLAMLLFVSTAMAQNVTDIQGIGPAYAEKLKAAGITKQSQLIDACAKKADRDKLAATTGLSSANLLKWSNRAELATVKGIGPQYAELLQSSDVQSVKELAQRNPDNLLATLKATNKEKKLTGKDPTKANVTSWIKNAKAMKSKVQE